MTLEREETRLHSALETASEAHNKAYILEVLPRRSSGERRRQQNDPLKREEA